MLSACDLCGGPELWLERVAHRHAVLQYVAVCCSRSGACSFGRQSLRATARRARVWGGGEAGLARACVLQRVARACVLQRVARACVLQRLCYCLALVCVCHSLGGAVCLLLREFVRD